MADNNEAEESIEGGDLIDLEWSDGDFCLFSCLHVKGENSTTLEEWWDYTNHSSFISSQFEGHYK